TVPKLLKIKPRQELAEVHIFKGKDMIQLMFDDQVKKNEASYVISSSEFEKKLWEYLKKKPHKRIIFGKPSYLIYPEKNRELAKETKGYKKFSVKFIPEEYLSEVGFEICGDSTYIQTDYEIIKIKDRKIAGGLKKYFDILWKLGRK
ncbi:hypothetical protein JXB01_04685, partial [Candidatus Micrarchaeota archaeon]|nr:hypothetical protein [Candidatus Micrarchaeota archaeon]